jgi:hypothetical protein
MLEVKAVEQPTSVHRASNFMFKSGFRTRMHENKIMGPGRETKLIKRDCIFILLFPKVYADYG